MEKQEKCQKKTAKRDIKECLEYTESSIQLFKTENSVAYSEPKDAGTTERVKYVTTILVNFIIKQGCISLFGEIKNKTKQNRTPPPPSNLKKKTRGLERDRRQTKAADDGGEEAVSCTLNPFDRGNCYRKTCFEAIEAVSWSLSGCKELKLTTKGDSATYQAISEVDGTFSIPKVFVPLFKYYECREMK